MPAIRELPRNKFHRCVPLLEHNRHTEVEAIVKENNTGRIFVDNLLSPQSGMVWQGNNDGFFFIGDAQSEIFYHELSSFIDTIIRQEMLAMELEEFEMIGTHPGWNKMFPTLFPDRSLQQWEQHVYTFEESSHFPELPPLHEKYKIKRITEALYESKSYINISYIHRKIKESWLSAEAFFEKGRGYCAVDGDEIVSLCYTNYAADRKQCIAIETSEAHQKKGLAARVGLHYVKDCIQEGLIPYWDCMASNEASAALARKLGFTYQFSYSGYEFSYGEKKETV
ncbi:GNAT family N-acetyltransferase [Alteribacillus sp. HJP-4]|uniref:GNAT family N-acetyltransferase n=1 Tax=Alteribacillus sp. HJP-4 TaxID=2775394 RepID=UPI0035CD11A0